MKNVRIRVFSGPYFPAFRVNTQRYSVSLQIQSEYVKIRPGKLRIRTLFTPWHKHRSSKKTHSKALHVLRVIIKVGTNCVKFSPNARRFILDVLQNSEYTSEYHQDHCVKSVRIRSFSGPYFPAFGLNTGRYEASLRIRCWCGKIGTWKTPNTDTSYAVNMFYKFYMNTILVLIFIIILNSCIICVYLICLRPPPRLSLKDV